MFTLPLASAALVLFDIGLWLVIHIAAALWFGTRKADFFDPGNALFREKKRERGGRLYERIFRVRAWKDSLPDGAAWFKGQFPKRRLRQHDPDYLRIFVLETCRAEALHLAIFLCAPFFFLFNPWYVGLVMIVYAALENLPCWIAQRYNRLRLSYLLGKKGKG